MTHLIDQIAERFRELLTDSTDAEDRVTRDLITPVAARTDLPWIDIKIGEETPNDEQVTLDNYIGRVQILVDLTVADVEQNVSSAVLELRRQAHVAVMTDNDFPDGVLSVDPAGASAVLRNPSGSTPIAGQQAIFSVLFEHSLTNPE